MIGVIGGTSLAGMDILEGFDAASVNNKYGGVYLLKNTDTAFLLRHGKDRRIPPHMVCHRANILALSDLGVEKIIAVGSVGSLKKEIIPGRLLIPHDYMNFGRIESYYDSEIRHITPGLDEFMSGTITGAAKKNCIDVFGKGVYMQARGPRLETRAEVSFMKNYADVVGMTLASEATLAKELGIPYACICTVDNYANGIIDVNLDFEEIIKTASKNREALIILIMAVLEELR